MTENLENTEIIEEITEEKERVNHFCIISKDTFGEYNIHDIQTNSMWTENPYPDYAIVPDEMVVDIMETGGFCDIELNEEETEIVSFTAREKPEIPTPEPETQIEEAEILEYLTDLDYRLSLQEMGV